MLWKTKIKIVSIASMMAFNHYYLSQQNNKLIMQEESLLFKMLVA